MVEPTFIPTELDYAPSLRRRYVIRACIAFVILIGSGAGWYWRWAVWDRIVIQWHQGPCLRYSAPPDQVVFDSNPARAVILAHDPNYVLFQGCAFRRPPSDWESFRDAVLESAINHSGTIGIRSHKPALLFLHECRSPNGKRFVIEVERKSDFQASAYFRLEDNISTTVISPATTAKIAELCEDCPERGIDVDESGSPKTDIRIYAGQSDPHDHSHFTIRYEERGATRIIDGRVDDNGKLILRKRDN